MWLLECEGDCLGDRRLWLKPGKKYVMGRVPSEEVNLPMPGQKSISRIHLVIEVEMVTEGDGLKLHRRSDVYVQDCGTRHGTRLDGEEMRGQTKKLSGRDEYFLHLGKYEPGFRLFWKPIVISFSLSSKDRKDIKKAMRPYQKKVERFNIKTIGGYAPETTHVIATKRNTAVGLQALVNGKRVVTPEYLDAIVEADHPSDDNWGGGSPLEVDFEGNWPDPENYLPPHTNEPKDREPWRFRPDKKRKSLFRGYTFIVCERVQYENFLGPITDAHGKLEMFELEPERTTAEELVQFVNKRERESQIVMVRFIGKQNPEWVNQLSTEVQEILGFRMLEQNEFLDIILMCDTSRLRRSLQDQTTPLLPDLENQMRSSTCISDSPPIKSTPTSTNPDTVKLETITSQNPHLPTQAPGRGRGRARTRQATLDPFAIDPSEFKPPPAQHLSGTTSQTIMLHGREPPRTQASIHAKETANQNLTSSTRSTRPTRQSQKATNTPIETVDERTPVSTPKSSTRSSTPQNLKNANQKRPAVLEDPESDLMDMLPGAREVKRRKIAEQEERIRRGETMADESYESTPLVGGSVEAAGTTEQTLLKSKGKKIPNKKEDPYAIRAREIKEEDEERARRAKEEELAAMDGLEIEKMRNLAIIEVMKIKPRTDKPVRGAYGDDGDRWDDRWNGRKNFKKFRRQGRGGGMRTMRGSVMVNLVEHQGKGYEIGDGYWVDDESKESTKGTHPRIAPVLAITGEDSDEGDDHLQSVHHNPVRSTRQTQTQVQSQTQTPTQTASATNTPSRGTKRGASTTNIGRADVGKKLKTMFLKNESGSEDDSEDELKFRFKRR